MLRPDPLLHCFGCLCLLSTVCIHAYRPIAVQVDEQALRSTGYSPATALELKRWCFGVASPQPMSARSQHTKTAVAAITFVMEHEPNPGTVVLCMSLCLCSYGPACWTMEACLLW